VALLFFLYQNKKKEERAMKKGNVYATNEGGIIKAPKAVKDSPKSTVIRATTCALEKPNNTSPRGRRRH
jgi:hypothetical protein